MQINNFEDKFNKARELLIAEDFHEALLLYQKLARQHPRASIIWLELGIAAKGLGRLDLAEKAWLQAQEFDPNNSEMFLRLGHQYQSLRQSEKARICFTRAAITDPKAINPRISLAVILEQAHCLDEARTITDECLKIDSMDDQARYLSAKLDFRENQLSMAENKLRDLIASKPKHPFVTYACRYELAQLLDRSGNFEEAMKLLIEAKKHVSSLVEVDAITNQYDQIARITRDRAISFPKNILKKWGKSFPAIKQGKIPPLAFLGGHPRSGTTLLEQVLDTHPSIMAYDETMAFSQLVVKLRNLDTASSSFLNVLRQGYIQSLQEKSDAKHDGRLLIDKNPSPTAFLPIWLRVFPELRVIIALRDPRDVVLSCYFQNIPLNQINSNFLSFERLAKHYIDLMSVWIAVREWEGFSWIETRYENVVSNLEKEGRRVTEFLGLEWDEKQMLFYEQSRKKKVFSPTYHDVTQPIYSRSVARWHAYEKYLAPILPILEPYCKQLGYS